MCQLACPQSTELQPEQQAELPPIIGIRRKGIHKHVPASLPSSCKAKAVPHLVDRKDCSTSTAASSSLVVHARLAAMTLPNRRTSSACALACSQSAGRLCRTWQTGRTAAHLLEPPPPWWWMPAWLR